MYRKKIYLTFLCVIVFAVVCVGLSDALQSLYNRQECNYEDVSVSGDSVVSRSSACKMLALLFYSHNDIESMPVITKYNDIGDGDWYDKYYFAADALGIEWGDGNCRPGDNLTCREALDVYRFFAGNKSGDVSTSAIVPDFICGSEDDYITFDQWIKLYDMIRELSAGNDNIPVKCRELYNESVFLISIIEDESGDWKVATDKGNLYFDGYAIDAYKNVAIDICTDGEEIVYVLGISAGPAKLANVLMTEYSEKYINVYCHGLNLELELSDESFEKLNQELNDIVSGSALAIAEGSSDTINIVVSLLVESGIVTDIEIMLDRRNDKIIAVTDNYIETVTYGRLPYAGEHKVYNLCDNPKLMSDSDINIGYSVADIVLDSEGKVAAVLITGTLSPDKIRVAITTSGHKSRYHKNVSVTSDMGMVVSDGTNTYEYQAEEVFEINKKDDNIIKSRINIAPSDGGRLIITSIDRSYGKPVYRGSIDLALYKKGIVVVNELPIDEYLYAVVPSEMPSEYGIEPLKAQAVCARGYAYMQILDSKLAYIGAHVDDTTSFQVYNNTRETEASIQAVNNTGGQVLKFNGKVISAYYFSTSCGHTADGSDVWLGMKEVPYLTGRLQDAQGTVMNLAKDDDFKAYIDSPPCDTFDSSFPWFRWNVTLTAQGIRSSLENAITARYRANPSLIKTKGEDGNYHSKPLTSIGDIVGIKVAKREESGIVTELILKGTEREIKVISEYNIRIILAPLFCSITRADRTLVNGLSILPSAFFYIDKEASSANDGTYVIKGGGYGHGVGMSQNGAKAMADAGYSYVDILNHYYLGCELSDGV